jgi:hypothetical protein
VVSGEWWERTKTLKLRQCHPPAIESAHGERGRRMEKNPQGRRMDPPWKPGTRMRPALDPLPFVPGSIVPGWARIPKIKVNKFCQKEFSGVTGPFLKRPEKPRKIPGVSNRAGVKRAAFLEKTSTFFGVGQGSFFGEGFRVKNWVKTQKAGAKAPVSCVLGEKGPVLRGKYTRQDSNLRPAV